MTHPVILPHPVRAAIKLLREEGIPAEISQIFGDSKVEWVISLPKVHLEEAPHVSSTDPEVSRSQH